MTEVNETLLNGKTTKVLKAVDQMISYYSKAKGAKPESITLSANDYDALKKTFKDQPQIITRKWLSLKEIINKNN